MEINQEKLRELLRRKKAVVFSDFKFVGDLSDNQMSGNLIVKTAKKIKKAKDLESLDLTGYNISIQVNLENHAIQIVAEGERQKCMQIVFGTTDLESVRIDNVFEVLGWECPNKELFIKMLFHSANQINILEDGTILSSNPTIWKNIKTGKFYFQRVKGLDNSKDYDSLDEAYEALKQTFVIKNEEILEKDSTPKQENPKITKLKERAKKIEEEIEGTTFYCVK